MVPEEHSYWALKQLIYPANWQWEIDETINSTITSSGKGRMSPESRKFALLDCGLAIATRRAKGMIIVVPNSAFSRKRCLAYHLHYAL
ncbi:hypothetical protein [Sphingobium sp. C100]|uniref:hypothetical protein n=1 Tax=Sphingobium sp. C100 TaxID=1207055 RepID=UPI0012692B07|nr:hypothetical protein [Sphingobium sp. C100]